MQQSTDKAERNRQVLVVGAMNLDVLAVADTSAIAGDSTPGVVGYYAGGVARNIAEGLARLGIETRLLSAVGADGAGRQLLASCEQAGIVVDSIQRLAGQTTSSYVAVNDKDGDLLYAVSDMRIHNGITVNQWPELEHYLHTSARCIIDCNLPEAVIVGLAAVVQQSPSATANKVNLVADAVSATKCVRLKKILTSISLLKVNRLEAATLTDSPDKEKTEVLLQKLLDSGVKAVLMTHGSDGVVYGDDTGAMHTAAAPATKVHCVNGAGDSLLAGVIAAGLYRQPIDEALRWGAVAAGLSLATASACSDQMTLDNMRLINPWQ